MHMILRREYGFHGCLRLQCLSLCAFAPASCIHAAYGPGCSGIAASPPSPAAGVSLLETPETLRPAAAASALQLKGVNVLCQRQVSR